MKLKILLIVIITSIVVGSVSVFATLSYEASQITYKTTTLDHAIDDLYTNLNSGTATSSDILSGKTAYSNGQLLTGTYKTPAMTFSMCIGSHGSSENIHQSRVFLTAFNGLYKYFKITESTCNTPGLCSSIYFNSSADQGSGNMSLNTQYLVSDHHNFTIYTTGSKSYFYTIKIYLYN